MKIIGITGPTGAGKSTALSLLHEFGAFPVDCDRVYHRLLDESEELRSSIADAFPSAAEGGAVMRRELGRIVFADPAAMDRLNNIAGRFILHEIGIIIENASNAGFPSAAVDAVLLFESGLSGSCDATICITASPERRIRRVMNRENIGWEYALLRASAQKSDEFYISKSDYSLRNNGNYGAFRRSLHDIYCKIMGGA